ncbi:hypothetical protein PO124_03410 [Bacillus licheniformis]|nr:hypothetical protein [Bacillus licheniformis]
MERDLNCEEDVFYFTLEELIALLENRGIGDIPELLADRNGSIRPIKAHISTRDDE